MRLKNIFCVFENLFPLNLKFIKILVCRSSRDGLFLSFEKKGTKDSQGALPP